MVRVKPNINGIFFTNVCDFLFFFLVCVLLPWNGNGCDRENGSESDRGHVRVGCGEVPTC